MRRRFRSLRDHGVERLFAVARLRDDRDVAFDFEQRGEGTEDHSLIFRENNANSLAPFFDRGP